MSLQNNTHVQIQRPESNLYIHTNICFVWESDPLQSIAQSSAKRVVKVPSHWPGTGWRIPTPLTKASYFLMVSSLNISASDNEIQWVFKGKDNTKWSQSPKTNSGVLHP